jgi:hypothetical protein
VSSGKNETEDFPIKFLRTELNYIMIKVKRQIKSAPTVHVLELQIEILVSMTHRKLLIMQPSKFEIATS